MPPSDLADRIAKLEQSREEGEQHNLQLWAAIRLLLDVCEHHGVINDGHRRLIDKLRERTSATRPKIRLRLLDDKYDVESAPVPCADLIELCHARCCSFAVELSRQDLEEQSLRWDIDQPYLLRRTDEGYCIYTDRKTGGCTTYETRPSTCRSYDCRNDKRVWLDYENKIPAPLQSFGLETATSSDD